MSTRIRNLSLSRVLAAGLLVFPALLIGTAPGQDDPEVEIVENPAQPSGGVVTISLTELWRVGGEDDEIFFGNVGAIRTDSQGNLYVLDSQLSETQVYSASGEHLRTIGGEGDGPGEVRNPNDMFLADDGNICVLQGFPGKIVELTPDGNPSGVTNYSPGEGAGGQFNVLIRGLADGPGLLLGGIRQTFGADGLNNQVYFLDKCDRQGKSILALAEKKVTVSFADLEMNEGASDFLFGRMALGPDRRVYLGIPRNEYVISVFSPQGVLEKIIKRPYESVVRTDEEKQVAHRIQEAIWAYYPTTPKRILIEDTKADIQQLLVAPDGRLWVQTSSGGRNAPDGCWLILDVYTPDGSFEKQVALAGDHDAERDNFTLLPDGRAVVVISALEAWLNQMGAIEKNADDAKEPAPLEIICYRLDSE